jgi:hypothetical protein
MRFSQRMGIRPPLKPFQTDSMDRDLRNGLWNAFCVECFDRLLGTDEDRFYARCWHEFFKLPLDEIGEDAPPRDVIRGRFFSAEWYDVYDFLEFALGFLRDVQAERFRATCNDVFERENAGYRFVGPQIAPITSESEGEAIEEAIDESVPFAGVHTHLKRALEHLSDRKNPDYRNSIKESISAVEALSCVVTGNTSATLGDALKRIEPRFGLHPALKQAFCKLYGWTSDAQGIRHALMDEEQVSFSDAKFMLVACSAFVNYLLGKAAESGTSLGAE